MPFTITPTDPELYRRRKKQLQEASAAAGGDGTLSDGSSGEGLFIPGGPLVPTIDLTVEDGDNQGTLITRTFYNLAASDPGNTFDGPLNINGTWNGTAMVHLLNDSAPQPEPGATLQNVFIGGNDLGSHTYSLWISATTPADPLPEFQTPQLIPNLLHTATLTSETGPGTQYPLQTVLGDFMRLYWFGKTYRISADQVNLPTSGCGDQNLLDATGSASFTATQAYERILRLSADLIQPTATAENVGNPHAFTQAVALMQLGATAPPSVFDTTGHYCLPFFLTLQGDYSNTDIPCAGDSLVTSQDNSLGIATPLCTFKNFLGTTFAIDFYTDIEGDFNSGNVLLEMIAELPSI